MKEIAIQGRLAEGVLGLEYGVETGNRLVYGRGKTATAYAQEGLSYWGKMTVSETGWQNLNEILGKPETAGPFTIAVHYAEEDQDGRTDSLRNGLVRKVWPEGAGFGLELVFEDVIWGTTE